MIASISPDSEAFLDSTGATFFGQNQDSNLNSAYWQINNEGDTIDFDVSGLISGMENPTMILYSAWGATDFQLEDISTGVTIVDEVSGFSTDVWIVDLSGRSGQLRLTGFGSDEVDGTEAAWLPFVRVEDLFV